MDNFWDKIWEEFYKEFAYEIDPDIVKLLKKEGEVEINESNNEIN